MSEEAVNKSSKGFNVKEALPWIFFALAAGGWLIFYVLHVEKLLDADMSSEMLLSQILADEHAIITPSWKYSTEIRFLNNQLVFSLFLGLFKNWRLSRALSGIVLLVLYGASYYYLCVQTDVKKYFPYTAALLFLPFSADYAYIVLYGLFYIPHIAVSFTSIGLCLQIQRCRENKKKVLPAVLLFLLSLAAGCGGPRQLIICYLPLLLIALFNSFGSGRFVWAGAYISFAGGVSGYALNRFVLEGRYHFNSWNNLNFTGFSFSRLETLIMGILHEFGYCEEPVFSAALIKNTACLIIMCGVLLYYVFYFRNKEEHGLLNRFVSEAVLSIAAVYFMLYLFTDMYYEDRYALPLIAFAPILTAFAMSEYAAGTGKKLMQRLFGGQGIIFMLLCAFAVAGLGRYPALLRTDKTTSLRELSAALKEQGYESGYASYWNGNIMCELSEGAFEMYNWDDYVSGKVDVEELYIWLQPLSHEYKKPEGKVFILLSAAEETECPLVRYLSGLDVAYRNEGYVAYGFESYEDMLAKLSDFEYDLSEGEWLLGGESTGEAWLLHEGGRTSGPNMTLYAGEYTVNLRGSGLESLVLNASAEFGEKELPLERMSYRMGEAVWQLMVDENTYHVEFNMRNMGKADVRIDSVLIERKEDAE